MLKGKTAVVGVCGGIAAYKAVEVVSRLKKLGLDVNVIMTKNAAEFVDSLTFRSISNNPVTIGMFDEPQYWDIGHISLANKADFIVVVPATANIIGKVAGGIADDMLSTTIMATRAPVIFVPAMNHNMYENPIVQSNIEKLKNLGYVFMEPASGLMACGTKGKGRLPEPSDIVKFIVDFFESENAGINELKNTSVKKDLKDLSILVTAGPTREAIDPVRYITNRSSGKMGYAIAECALKRGAKVKIVSGPVNIPVPSGAEVENVISAREMYQKVMESYKDYDVLVMVAAVADYRCEEISQKKIKKSQEEMTIKLVKNPDIAKELGKVKDNRILVGFSAETDDVEKNALEKLQSKNMDMIVANDVTQEGAGFSTDTNIVKIIKGKEYIKSFPIMDKTKVADVILDEILLIRSTKGC
ncbi:MAG TPA: bifunctional phosphopantothenoylcysteine decarboxylase/phosphopantothenate--cysteine ligase CoaBC [Acetivibrio saccincola]|uniref:bifunctional phosphopantothenoylcysteine decarboxylase/phosphopantothenate--cysteine ligase CoaBC n=1 Tax=Acetivibrio saccincola TaxID=1677857 RepID=UPI002B9A0141|nr:bifunctional phosphopantothenoylcysteine decarboxylase/phosphopantothenate--cysteine ligase CoaBC [Acetivibrio saccincola]HOA97301.1 bifunctional phosphopantothenoylcysteine decarboxylase/phosphopantothenate--cysteine ligase CoaBC [Acetivibrio saccincola]HQD27726.1 bifunctional phosphopantothenoylcysteine decarboxylase/phosphopantothenate--cysteine ligase CoaBC [Acetivibrio saccincola]